VSFAIPNGGQRSLTTGKKLKAEGVTSGVPDCFIGVPMIHDSFFSAKQYSGLFIEFKKKPNVLSFNQRVMIKNLTENGYYCAVCYSLDEAIAVVKKYIGNLNGLGTTQK
jgi:hypothetical protein